LFATKLQDDLPTHTASTALTDVLELQVLFTWNVLSVGECPVQWPLERPYEENSTAVIIWPVWLQTNLTGKPSSIVFGYSTHCAGGAGGVGAGVGGPHLQGLSLP